MIDGGERSQDHKAVESDESAGIPTYTFADVLSLSGCDEIALFKCDIEGSEFSLFEASHQDDIARIRRYAIEYHDNIRPGTLPLLESKLRDTHSIRIEPAPDHYGMLYAVRLDLK